MEKMIAVLCFAFADAKNEAKLGREQGIMLHEQPELKKVYWASRSAIYGELMGMGLDEDEINKVLVEL